MAQQVIVGADEWQGFTNSDGSGVYFELLKKVFPEHTLKFKTAPLDETITALANNELTMVVGVYRDDVEKAMFPQWFLDTEYPVVAIYNAKKNPISHLSELSQLKLSWIKGYHFERYISSNKPNILLDNIDDAFEFLANGKVDAFLDYPYNLTEEENKIYSTIEVAPSRHLYVAFQHNKNGKKLAEQFDKNMALLRDDGTLKALYGDEYPHSELAKVNIEKTRIRIFTNSVSLFAPNNQIFSLSDIQSAKSLHFVFDRLNDYQFDFHMIEDISKMYLYKNEKSVCFTDLIKTDERAKYFIASQPLSLFLGLQLYSNDALPIEGKVKLIEFFKNNSHYVLGSAKGRSYGELLDQQLSRISRQQFIQSPVSLSTLFKQLEKNRFDLVIEYPSLKQVYASKKLFNYTIDDAETYVLGHMMCNNSTVGTKFIQQFNRVLDELKLSAAFFNAQYRRTPDENQAEFTRLFKQVFN